MRNGLRGFYASTLADYSLDSLKADLRAAMKNAPGIPYLTPLLVEIQMLEVVRLCSLSLCWLARSVNAADSSVVAAFH